MSQMLTPAPRPDVPDAAARDARHTLGERLRRIRRQQGLSLSQVEQKSDGVWKAVVVGAYERGDRAISIDRLAALAAFYSVPISELLPIPSSPVDVPPTDQRLVIDLVALEADDSPLAAAVSRFVRRILDVRGDHNGRVLTMRSLDLDNLAALGGVERGRLVAELRARGIFVTRP